MYVAELTWPHNLLGCYLYRDYYGRVPLIEVKRVLVFFLSEITMPQLKIVVISYSFDFIIDSENFM